jgi:hypothetical protein
MLLRCGNLEPPMSQLGRSKATEAGKAKADALSASHQKRTSGQMSSPSA